MKFKKSKKFVYFIFSLVIVSLPVITQAAKLTNPLGSNVSFELAISRVITSAIGISGVLALIAFIFGGVTWMISSGDTAKIQKGKNMMLWAVFGIVTIFSSYAVLTFIFKSLIGDGGSPGIGSDTPAIVPED